MPRRTDICLGAKGFLTCSSLKVESEDWLASSCFRGAWRHIVDWELHFDASIAREDAIRPTLLQPLLCFCHALRCRFSIIQEEGSTTFAVQVLVYVVS